MSADWNRSGYIHVPAPCRQVRKCCFLTDSALGERQRKFYDVVLCHIIICCITMNYLHIFMFLFQAGLLGSQSLTPWRHTALSGTTVPDCLGTELPSTWERCSQPLGRAVPTTVCQRMPCFSELHIYFNAFRIYLNMMIKRTENRNRRQKGRLIISTKLGVAEYRIILYLCR